MIRAAQHRVAQKVEAEGWAGGISFGWLVKLSRVKRSWCNGICRFTILRWALNQDDDVWLSLRGTRHNQPCQLCGQSTDVYPMGFWHSPISESCIRSHAITPASLYPDSSVLFDLYRQETRTEANIHQTSARIVHSYFHGGTTEDSGEAPTDEGIRSKRALALMRLCDYLESYIMDSFPVCEKDFYAFLCHERNSGAPVSRLSGCL